MLPGDPCPLVSPNPAAERAAGDLERPFDVAERASDLGALGGGAVGALCLAGYSAITFRGPVEPEDLYVALAPIIDAIAPVARFRRLADDEIDGPTTAEAPFPDAAGPPLALAAARRLHDLYDRRAGRVNRRDGLVDDAGLAWLIELRLADRNERGIPGMAPWLFDVMQDRLGVHPDPEARLRRRLV